MKLPLRTRLALPALLAAAAPAAAHPPHSDGGCPDDGGCHLPRWSPTGHQAFDRVGAAVAIDGDTAVLGAPGEDAVHVYGRDGAHWVEVERLDSPTVAGAEFGAAVAIHGDDLVVGAPDDPGSGVQRGSMHVYRRVGDTFLLQLSLPGTEDFGRFGAAVDVDDEWLVVGEPGTGSGGRVRVHHDNDGDWTGTQAIQVPGAGELGSALALNGENLLVGDWADDDRGANAGAAYHFVLDPVGNTLLQKITAPDGTAGDFFGYAVGFDAGAAAVGAYGDDDQGLNAGAAYVYELDEAGLPFALLGFEDKLFGCGTNASDNFGRSVDVEDGRVLVGAPNQQDLLEVGGRAHLFEKGLFFGLWTLVDTLSEEDGLDGDDFGEAVALSGELALAGAPGYAVPGALAGGGYLFSLQTAIEGLEECPCDAIAVWETYGDGKPGTLGVPVLELDGQPLLGESTLIRLKNVPAGTAPLLIWGTTAGAAPFDGGELLIGDPHVVAMPTVTGLQQVGVGWPIPFDVALCGEDYYLQAMLLDPGAAGTWHTAQSNGVQALLGF